MPTRFATATLQDPALTDAFTGKEKSLLQFFTLRQALSEKSDYSASTMAASGAFFLTLSMPFSQLALDL